VKRTCARDFFFSLLHDPGENDLEKVRPTKRVRKRPVPECIAAVAYIIAAEAEEETKKSREREARRVSVRAIASE